MADLNQYAISKALGSKMKQVKNAQFGNFALLETTAEAVRAKDRTPDLLRSNSGFSYDDDRVVLQSFESVRDGASTDALLWDPELLAQFVDRCRQLGLDAADSVLARRLINIRKNKRRYEKHGISLSETTKKEPHPSVVPQFAHAVEFALVKLRYRHGASIDDILLDQDLTKEYEKLAHQIVPQLSPQELRLAALYIRKTRFIGKNERELVRKLKAQMLNRKWSKPVGLSHLDPSSVPVAPGLIEVKEGERFLYVARNENLQPTIVQFATGHPFDIVSGNFWAPDPEAITLQFIAGEEINGIATRQWEHFLIHKCEPIFNWPIHQNAA